MPALGDMHVSNQQQQLIPVNNRTPEQMLWRVAVADSDGDFRHYVNIYL